MNNAVEKLTAEKTKQPRLYEGERKADELIEVTERFLRRQFHSRLLKVEVDDTQTVTVRFKGGAERCKVKIEKDVVSVGSTNEQELDELSESLRESIVQWKKNREQESANAARA